MSPTCHRRDDHMQNCGQSRFSLAKSEVDQFTTHLIGDDDSVPVDLESNLDAPVPSGTSRSLEIGQMTAVCDPEAVCWQPVRCRSTPHAVPWFGCSTLHMSPALERANDAVAASRAHSTFPFRNTFRAAHASPAVHRRLQGWTWQDCRFIA